MYMIKFKDGFKTEMVIYFSSYNQNIHFVCMERQGELITQRKKQIKTETDKLLV